MTEQCALSERLIAYFSGKTHAAFRASRYRSIKWIVIVLSSAMLTGCANGRYNQIYGNVTPVSGTPPLLKGYEEKPPHLCLALSGGGIRSGAVSFGVLQALSQAGKLGKFEYLTTVSGGGYPVFGLLKEHNVRGLSTKEMLAEGSRFERELTKEARFIDGTSKVFGAVALPFNVLFNLAPKRITHSSIMDFLTGKTAKEFHVYGSALSGDYAGEIGRSFAPDVGITARVPLIDMELPADFPYPIFLASQSEGSTAVLSSEKYRAEHLFELSAHWIGSDETKYWPKYVEKLLLAHAITSSGAALDTPTIEGRQNRVIPDWAKKMGIALGISMYLPDGKRIFLSDGGFIENQAVLPLVRRGCQQIIALDATMDAEADFVGWHDLAKLAKDFDWEITLPKDLGDNEKRRKSGWDLQDHIIEIEFHRSGNPKEPHRILVMKLGYNAVLEEQYDKRIVEYAKKNWKNGDWNKDTMCNDESGLNEQCAFPLESTADQSFGQDEYEAYRLLGQHMARQVLKTADL